MNIIITWFRDPAHVVLVGIELCTIGAFIPGKVGNIMSLIGHDLQSLFSKKP